MKLDNAAKIYPAITGSELTGVFRISVRLKQPVILQALIDAAREVSSLFPMFSVDLHKGIFWYYLEYNGRPPRIHADSGPRCQPFPVAMNGELVYRLLVKGSQISVEFFHILTDGGGATFFLKVLINHYFIHAYGITDPPFPEVTETKPDETRDDQFSRYYVRGLPRPEPLPRAWHLPFRLRQAPRFRVTEFLMNSGSLASEARKQGGTVTEYLAAVMLYALQEIRLLSKSGSPHIRVQVPFDLRRRFDISTMRNFSLFVIPEIDTRLGHYSFPEILNEVRIAIQMMTDEKRIRKVISRNVSKEKNPLIRIIPLFIKSPVLRIAYNRFGPSQFTSTITNMGRITASGMAATMMDSMSVTPPPPHPDIKVTAGLITLGDNTIITFGSLTDNRELERRFVKQLTSSGIEVKIIKE